MPAVDLPATADARYGSYGQYRFDVDVTGPLRKGLFFRLASSYDQDIHYWKPYDASSWDISPSLLWQPTDGSASLKYEHSTRSSRRSSCKSPATARQRASCRRRPTPTCRAWSARPAGQLEHHAYADFRRSDTNGLSAWVDFKADEHWNLRAAYSHQDYGSTRSSPAISACQHMTFLQGRRLSGQTYTNRGETFDVEAVGSTPCLADVCACF